MTDTDRLSIPARTSSTSDSTYQVECDDGMAVAGTLFQVRLELSGLDDTAYRTLTPQFTSYDGHSYAAGNAAGVLDDSGARVSGLPSFTEFYRVFCSKFVHFSLARFYLVFPWFT